MTRYFEDFSPGETLQLGAKSITAEEIINFAREFDPQPFHIDPQAARSSSFGGLVASGVQTFGMFMRLFVDGVLADAANLGGAGADDMRFLVPVRPGDTISARVIIQPQTRPSATKPDRGVLVIRAELSNQDDQLVWHATITSIMRRRPT